jgi:hypothetical protein
VIQLATKRTAVTMVKLNKNFSIPLRDLKKSPPALPKRLPIPDPLI